MRALEIAIIGVVYSSILTQPDMILDRWYIFLEQKIGNKSWLFNPLVGCYKCVTGQIALWYYIFTCNHYNLWNHMLFISLSIFISIILNFIYVKTT
jgi:hypothetical protein